MIARLSMDSALVENIDVLVAIEDAMAALIRSNSEDAWEDCVRLFTY